MKYDFLYTLQLAQDLRKDRPFFWAHMVDKVTKRGVCFWHEDPIAHKSRDRQVSKADLDASGFTDNGGIRFYSEEGMKAKWAEFLSWLGDASVPPPPYYDDPRQLLATAFYRIFDEENGLIAIEIFRIGDCRFSSETQAFIARDREPLSTPETVQARNPFRGPSLRIPSVDFSTR